MTTIPTRRLLSTRAGAIAYWTTTAILATECIGGGVMGALRLPPFIGIATDLGYPAYLLTIMGVWKVPGAVALLIPGFPPLKEWAYAGAVITYVCAIAPRLTVGDQL